MLNLAHARTSLAIVCVGIASVLGISSCSDAVPIDPKPSGSSGNGSGGDSGSAGDGGSGGDAGSAGNPNGGPPKCCALAGMQAGECVKAISVPEQKDYLAEDSCPKNQDYVCAPTALLKNSAQSCKTIEEHEGRCTELCVPQVNKLRDYIPVGTCNQATHRCAPCYNPIDNKATGLCTATPAWSLADCGNGRGKCVRSVDLPARFQNSAPQETCAADRRCVPTELLRDPSYRFPSCMSAPTIPGGCVPDYLQKPGVPLLPCPGGLCAPCTSLGEPTGACGLN